jgi:hypothetical protein
MREYVDWAEPRHRLRVVRDERAFAGIDDDHETASAAQIDINFTRDVGGKVATRKYLDCYRRRERRQLNVFT